MNIELTIKKKKCEKKISNQNNWESMILGLTVAYHLSLKDRKRVSKIKNNNNRE